ncbi:hypothetical protein GGF32_006109 [Allomyces javanicus]|nr:hypothetical protein GGF32_006109 [Allomyces javanicus]
MAQHEYFITVLERVVEILAPFCTTVAKTQGSLESVQSLTNWFAALSTQDNRDAVEDLPVRVSNAKEPAASASTRQPSQISYEIEHAEELLHELDRIREHVNGV